MKEPKTGTAGQDEIPVLDGPSCGNCDLWFTAEGPSPGPHFVTNREVEVLDRMRRLKEEVHELKERMREMPRAEKQGEGSLSARLAALRQRWKELDRERIAAAEERMRLLGHGTD